MTNYNSNTWIKMIHAEYGCHKKIQRATASGKKSNTQLEKGPGTFAFSRCFIFVRNMLGVDEIKFIF